MAEARAGGSAYTADPGRVTDLAHRLREGSLTATALVERCLARIGEVEPHVQAWRVVDTDGALAQAAALDAEAAAGRWRGPLHGIPVGVKDIIDVAGLPTRANSRLHAEAAPAAADAEVVAALRAAGAVILGKTHTTEYAFFDPSPARNPHHIEHTPGGSSSGSGAAVAAGMVPLALGTQTAGSVNRPAMYCGVAAFKPTTQSTPLVGVLPLSPSFDTVGCYGHRVADAVAAYLALAPPALRFTPGPVGTEGRPLRVVRVEDDLLADAEPAVLAPLDALERVLGERGHAVQPARSPVPLAEVSQAHWRIMAYEVGHLHGALLRQPAGLVGEKLRGLIEEGQAVSPSDYLADRAALLEARERFWTAFSDADALLFAVAPQTAPHGLAWTGDPRFLSPFTALAGPLLSLPMGAAPNGLPVGALVCGRPGTDIAFASLCERIADAL